MIGNLSQLVSARKQLKTDAMWCYFDAFLTSVEPKNFKQAILEPSWIDAMQEETYEFERLQGMETSRYAVSGDVGYDVSPGYGWIRRIEVKLVTYLPSMTKEVNKAYRDVDTANSSKVRQCFDSSKVLDTSSRPRIIQRIGCQLVDILKLFI
ncbi:hypothetical protein Tco_0730679 [Tanacetum coccineum]|uniref:Integrase, catalytic region, zinc finger, CCHC-type, peptidase aspartic, catalytic n=1 Tax=Tanacetum coccineum TaxID=301880 RepID=A0ABQ4YVY5_9ASTR